MAADGVPGKVVSQEVVGGFDGLHEDMATVGVLGFEVGHGVEKRCNGPEPFFGMEDGQTPLPLKETVEFGEDGFHGVALGQGSGEPCREGVRPVRWRRCAHARRKRAGFSRRPRR